MLKPVSSSIVILFLAADINTYSISNGAAYCHFYITVEPRFNEVAEDRSNLFVKWRVRYIENLDITTLRENDQNLRYIEVVVNDLFLTQSGDFCGNNIVPMSMTYNKLLTEKLLSFDLYHNDFTIRIC